MSVSRLFSPTTFLLPRSTLHHIALFHTALAWRSESASYYEILGVDSNASAGDIKKCATLYMPFIVCLHYLGGSTYFPRPITQIIIPVTHKPRSTLSRSQKLTPSLVARRSEHATIETFKAPRVRLGPTHRKAPIRVLRLLSVPDLRAD